MNSFKNLDFNESELDGLKKIILCNWEDTPVAKYFKTKAEFLVSDKCEIGARGDLIFMAFFNTYDKDYTCYLLQIDDEQLLENMFNKWIKILKEDKDNPHLHTPFKMWYLMEFKPLWNKLYKKDN